MRQLTLFAAAALVGACQPVATEPVRPSISYKTKVENTSARVDKSYRLSETETVKVIIVPGHPMGERCIVYSNGPASTMQCSELRPADQ